MFHNQGKEKCPAKQVPDNVIKEMAKGFDKEISKIIVLPNNELKFVFDDSSEHIITWKQPSRKDSWTDEMKEAAQQQTLSRNRGER